MRLACTLPTINTKPRLFVPELAESNKDVRPDYGPQVRIHPDYGVEFWVFDPQSCKDASKALLGLEKDRCLGDVTLAQQAIDFIVKRYDRDHHPSTDLRLLFNSLQANPPVQPYVTYGAIILMLLAFNFSLGDASTIVGMMQ